MPQPDSAKPVTAAQRASDLGRINTLAALLTSMGLVVRAYLRQRALVPVSLMQHFTKQRATDALWGVYDPTHGWFAVCDDPDAIPEVYLDERCPVVPRTCCITLIEERAKLNNFGEAIGSLAAKALPIVRTAAPHVQHRIGESVGQYLTEVAMRLKEIVGTIQEDLDALEDAVQSQVTYAPWMEDWTNRFCDPGTAATDLLEHGLLPKLYNDALWFGSLAMPSESTGSDSGDAKQTPTDQESVKSKREPEEESKVVTLKHAADNWFPGFTRQALRTAIDDGTVAAKCFARGKWVFCLVELQHKGEKIYRDALPESGESE